MKLADMLTTVRESLVAKRVYGEPYRVDGLTVIPAAAVAGAAGGDSGPGDTGGGGGFGLSARPSGAYVVKDGTVRWQPALDVNRLAVVVGLVVVAGLLCGIRMIRLREQGRSQRAALPVADEADVVAGRAGEEVPVGAADPAGRG